MNSKKNIVNHETERNKPVQIVKTVNSEKSILNHERHVKCKIVEGIYQGKGTKGKQVAMYLPYMMRTLILYLVYSWEHHEALVQLVQEDKVVFVGDK